MYVSSCTPSRKYSMTVKFIVPFRIVGSKFGTCFNATLLGPRI